MEWSGKGRKVGKEENYITLTLQRPPAPSGGGGGGAWMCVWGQAEIRTRQVNAG